MTTVPTSSLPIAAIPVERFVERLYAPLAWDATVRLGDPALASRLVERVLHRAWDERERFATFDALTRHVQDAAAAAVGTEADRRRDMTRFDHASPDAPTLGALESMSVEAVQRRIGERRAPSPTPPQVVAVLHHTPSPSITAAGPSAAAPIAPAPIAPAPIAPAPIAPAPIAPAPPVGARPPHAPRLSMSANRVDAPRPSAQSRPSARASASVRSPLHTAEHRKAAAVFGGAAARYTTAQKRMGIALAFAAVLVVAIAVNARGPRDPQGRALAALADTTGASYDAAPGAMNDVTLPDSSRARLGSGAFLGTNARFGEGARALRIVGPVEVRLLNDSAALVAIQAGEHRFITAGAVAAFSLSALGQVAVQVDSGALVLVRDSSRTRLVAGSMVRIDTGTPASLSREERDHAFGWRKGRMQLAGAPLSDIAAASKLWYDVVVQFPMGRAASDTASLDVPLGARDSLVTGLERALGARATVTGNRLVLQSSTGSGAANPRASRNGPAPARRRPLPAPPALALPALPPLD